MRVKINKGDTRNQPNSHLIPRPVYCLPLPPRHASAAQASHTAPHQPEAAAHRHAVSHPLPLPLPPADPPDIIPASTRRPRPIHPSTSTQHTHSIFSGSLLSKRKPELVEIGAALGLPTDDIRVTDLVKSIQAHLDANEAQLASNPTFKGLFYRKRS